MKLTMLVAMVLFGAVNPQVEVGCGGELNPSPAPVSCYLDADERAEVAAGKPDLRPASCFEHQDDGTTVSPPIRVRQTYWAPTLVNVPGVPAVVQL